jgi:hypothetical protein
VFMLYVSHALFSIANHESFQKFEKKNIVKRKL